MTAYCHRHGDGRHAFADLRALLAEASPRRSGDELAGLAAPTQARRIAARMALADLPLKTFLNEALVPYETDEVTRLIIDTHDAAAFAPLAAMTVGDFREYLLDEATDSAALKRIAPGLTPEMAAAVSKLMTNGDLVAAAAKCAGLEDHFCGKLLGLPMGVDVCYTNHSEAEQLASTAPSSGTGLSAGLPSRSDPARASG